jgi:hypothetical protein
MRAVALAGAAIAILLASLAFANVWTVTTPAPRLVFAIVLAAAAYLAQKPGLFYKATAGIAAGAGALACFLGYVAAPGSFMSAGFYQSQVPLISRQTLGVLTQTLLVAAAVVLAGWFAAKLRPGDTRKQTTLAALFAGGVFAVLTPLTTLALGLNPPFLRAGLAVQAGVAGPLLTAVALGLAVKLVCLLCLLPSRAMTVGVGPKIWLWLCLAGGASATFMAGVPAQQSFEQRGWWPDFFQIVCCVVLTVGYLQLARSRRLGYVLVLIGSGTMVFAGVLQPVMAWVTTLASPPWSWFVRLVMPAVPSLLGGVLNPTITGLVLLRAWKTVPAEPPAMKRPVPAVFKACAIVTLTAGLAGFLVGSGVFLIDPAYQNLGGYLLFVLPWAATAVLGVYATVSCFDKRAKGSRPLLVTSAVVGGLAIALMVAAVILSLANG